MTHQSLDASCAQPQAVDTDMLRNDFHGVLDQEPASVSRDLDCFQGRLNATLPDGFPECAGIIDEHESIISPPDSSQKDRIDCQPGDSNRFRIDPREYEGSTFIPERQDGCSTDNDETVDLHDTGECSEEEIETTDSDPDNELVSTVDSEQNITINIEIDNQLQTTDYQENPVSSESLLRHQGYDRQPHTDSSAIENYYRLNDTLTRERAPMCIVVIPASALPASLCRNATGNDSMVSGNSLPTPESLVSGLQRIFRPESALRPEPRMATPDEFLADLRNNLFEGSGGDGAPTPTEFICNLQRDLVKGDDNDNLPTPPRPEQFFAQLADLMGYHGDNQQMYPQPPSPEQFLRGLTRILGLDSAPVGNARAFRTLGPRHAAHGNNEFRVPGPSASSFNPLDPLGILPIEPPNPLDLAPPGLPAPRDIISSLPGPLDFAPVGLPTPGEVISFLPNPLDLAPPGLPTPQDLISGLPVSESGGLPMPHELIANGIAHPLDLAPPGLPTPHEVLSELPHPFDNPVDKVKKLIDGPKKLAKKIFGGLF